MAIPGKKIPNKYPKTGPNYAKWGEQEWAGYSYDWETDRYYADPAAKARYEAEVQREIEGEPPKPPGVWEQAAAASLPILASAAAIQGGEKLPALFGIGGTAAGGAQTAGTAAGAAGTTGAIGPAGTGAGTAKLSNTAGFFGMGDLSAPGSVSGGAGSGGGLLSLGGIGSAGNIILPAAGMFGAANLLGVDRLDKNARGYSRGIGQGALSGAAIGSYFGPVGAMIGAGIGGLLGLGKAAFGHKSTAEYQQQRRNELLGRDITGYSDFSQKTLADDQAYREKYKDSITSASGFRSDLPDDFVGYDPDSGRWINNKFAKSLDTKDLRPEDVVGSNGVWDTFGDDWFGKYTHEERMKIAEALLKEGVFDTDHGDVVIYSENRPRAREIADRVLNNKEEEEKYATI